MLCTVVVHPAGNLPHQNLSRFKPLRTPLIYSYIRWITMFVGIPLWISECGGRLAKGKLWGPTHRCYRCWRLLEEDVFWPFHLSLSEFYLKHIYGRLIHARYFNVSKQTRLIIRSDCGVWRAIKNVNSPTFTKLTCLKGLKPPHPSDVNLNTVLI